MTNTSIDPSILNCAADAINCTRCRLRYTGEYCEIDLGDSFPHVFLVVLNQVISHSTSLFFFIWIFYGMYHKLIVQRRPPFNLAMITIYSLSIALVLRIIGHVDMFNFYFLVSPYFTLIDLSGYMTFLLSGTFLGVSVWFSIISGMKKLKLDIKLNFAKYFSMSIALILIIILTIVVIFGVALDNISPIILVMTGVLALASIMMIVMIAYHLPIFSKAIDKTKLQGSNEKLKRMKTYFIAYMVIAAFTMVGQIIPYVSYRNFYTPNDPEFLLWYAGVELITRCTESVVVALSLLLILDWFPYISHGGQFPTGTNTRGASQISQQQSRADYSTSDTSGSLRV